MIIMYTAVVFVNANQMITCNIAIVLDIVHRTASVTFQSRKSQSYIVSVMLFATNPYLINVLGNMPSSHILGMRVGYKCMSKVSQNAPRDAECSKQWNILKYFRSSLSYHLSLRPLFCLFLSGRLRQVPLYLPCVIRFFSSRLCFVALIISSHEENQST